MVDSDDPDTIIERLQPIADIAPLLDHSVGLTSYDQVMESMLSEAPQQGQGEPHSHSGLIRHITPAFAKDAAALLEAGSAYFFQIRSVGRGGVRCARRRDRVRVAERELLGRSLRHPVLQLDPWWEKLIPHMEGMYFSFESATGPEVLARAFPPEHLARLRTLKRRYDPTGLFRDNFFIDPEAAEGADDRAVDGAA